MHTYVHKYVLDRERKIDTYIHAIQTHVRMHAFPFFCCIALNCFALHDMWTKNDLILNACIHRNIAFIYAVIRRYYAHLNIFYKSEADRQTDTHTQACIRLCLSVAISIGTFLMSTWALSSGSFDGMARCWRPQIFVRHISVQCRKVASRPNVWP